MIDNNHTTFFVYNTFRTDIKDILTNQQNVFGNIFHGSPDKLRMSQIRPGFKVFKNKKTVKDYLFHRLMSGLLDSNQRPLRPERSALPTALNPDLRLQRYCIFLNYVHIYQEKCTKICIINKKRLSLHSQKANNSVP